MAEAAQSADRNALRRKASVGHRAREVEGLSPTRALRLSVARAAGDLWELPLSVTGIRHEIVAFEDLPERLSDETMMVLLDGPGAVRGGATVDRDLLTSITEVQTLGEVTNRAPADRPFTATDAAMVAPLLDAVLERLDLTLAGSAQAPGSEVAWILGYRFGAVMDNARTLTLALEGQGFHMVYVDIDVAAGMRRGQFILVLPETVDAPPQKEDAAPDHGESHADSLRLVPAELTATLPRITMPLVKATTLKVGDELVIDPNALNNVALRGPDGEILARCHLGKVAGGRALRLKARPGQTVPAPMTPEQAAFTPAREPERELAPPPAPAPVLPDMTDTITDLPTEEEELPELPPLDFDPGEGNAMAFDIDMDDLE